MTWINAALSLLVTMGLAASALGWRHSMTRWDWSAEWYFATAKVLYSIGMGFLLLAWGAVWGVVRLLDHGAGGRMLDAPGAPYANGLGLLVLLAGVYCSLRARWLLIPEDERGDWPWWLAWLHPRRPLWRR